MVGPRGYYAEWNKSDWKTQMSYDFTYMWNLINKINEQVKQKWTHGYREHLMISRLVGDWGDVWKKWSH